MIRPARLDELEALTGLMHRSKAYWGYDENFMAAARAVLQLSDHDVETGRLFVYDADGPQGLCKLLIHGETAELDKLFVAPEGMGKGVGRALVQWAIETARAAGATRMEIEADPDAVRFYQRMGAREVGRVPSEAIAGRTLPLMQIDLTDLAAGGLRSI
ncbi:GNAT family N-acetyltransferase [Tateyamaria omphalii]|uniref:GNAT family N-acetyltransferase n=1 Tax=Tateyamaria omphalii TaxID=299262 RepID=UPI001C99063A|nr:GNAT family N-acetyltransferase [Tateyamaria omphalii]MBY5933245.1 GNAT family N-acetyltransferase [Tateyamaria omphalii]